MSAGNEEVRARAHAAGPAYAREPMPTYSFCLYSSEDPSTMERRSITSARTETCICSGRLPSVTTSSPRLCGGAAEEDRSFASG